MNFKFLGIDIAAAKFDAALWNEKESYRQQTFSNNEHGFSSLLQWVGQSSLAQIHICMEATGSYGLGLAQYLHQAGFKVSVVNPACIKAFAQSELQRTKTDRVDARLIARFCRAMQPALWQPLSQEVAELQALVRRLEELVAMRSQELCRLKAPGSAASVQASRNRLVTSIDQEIASVQQMIKELFRRFPELKAKRDLLCSIPGIGEATATLLLAENTQNRDYKNARQLAAYAGLVPRLRQSGSSVRGKARLSKQGNVHLRKALYWPAIVAMQHNPPLRAFAKRLQRAGKAKLVIIGALMRKLIHQVFGVLKSNQPFNPNFQCAKP